MTTEKLILNHKLIVVKIPVNRQNDAFDQTASIPAPARLRGLLAIGNIDSELLSTFTGNYGMMTVYLNGDKDPVQHVVRQTSFLMGAAPHPAKRLNEAKRLYPDQYEIDIHQASARIYYRNYLTSADFAVGTRLNYDVFLHLWYDDYVHCNR